MKTLLHTLKAALMLLFLCFSALTAQEQTAQEKMAQEQNASTRQISYRIFFAPQMQYRSLFSNGSEQTAVQERNETETAQIGFTTGIGAEYALSEHWSITAGIAFSDRGYQTRLRNLQFVSQTAQDQVVIQQSYVAYHFLAIDIPLGILYRFAQENNWTFFASVEALPSIVIQKNKALWVSSENVWTATQVSRTRGFDRFALLLKGSVGADYHLSNTFTIRANAHFQHSLTAVNPNLATRDYLYAGGVELGLVWTP